MGSLNKLVKSGIKDAEVKEDNLAPGVATTAKFGPDAVESSEIGNGTVTADDLASTLDLSSKTVTLPSSSVNFDREYFNISLLGFKMAVNESLTVFNLVDGVVDEFHDESGTDESEGSNDIYCASEDSYSNAICISAGFSMTTITEPDTSTAGTNPAQGSGTMGTFTVPANVTSANLFVWGAGGGGACTPFPSGPQVESAGGAFSTGTLAVTPGQSLYVSAGEGGASNSTSNSFLGGGEGEPGSYGNGGAGGGLAGVMSGTGTAPGCFSAPQAILIAGSGGGAGNKNVGGLAGGPAGGQGGAFNPDNSHFNTAQSGIGHGGGGDQEQGGQGGIFENSGSAGPTSNPGPGTNGQTGGLFYGGDAGVSPQGAGGGGSGYYGGGGGGGCTYNSTGGAGGGGSAYISHPQITSGSTLTAQPLIAPNHPFPNPNFTNFSTGAGTTQPNYVACTNEGGNGPTNAEDGFVLVTSSVTASTTIVSTSFSATSVPTSSRIVVFQENIDTPTLNTDVIASISRDGGSNYTNATLSDSGYVTGSSGQRILTGQATISGQPSGQSMRWKIALANNKVKIHGVSLSWA